MQENLCPYIERNPDTTFYIFFPPYSILYWNDVMQENHLEATMREYAHIADTLLTYDNVRVFYFPNREEIVTDLNNYADAFAAAGGTDDGNYFALVNLQIDALQDL